MFSVVSLCFVGSVHDMNYTIIFTYLLYIFITNLSVVELCYKLLTSVCLPG